MIAILPTGLDNRTFFVDFSREITEKGFKRTKKVEKVVRPCTIKILTILMHTIRDVRRPLVEKAPPLVS